MFNVSDNYNDVGPLPAVRYYDHHMFATENNNNKKRCISYASALLIISIIELSLTHNSNNLGH